MADKLTFMKSWYDDIMSDEFVKTTPQEMAYMLYGAMMYSFDGNPIDLGEVFGPEYKGLNRAMPTIYGQINRIQQYGEKNGKKNQKYDSEAIRKLAEKGYTQEQVCLELGYDVAKKRSLSTNPGWREGKDKYQESKKKSEMTKSYPETSEGKKLTKLTDSDKTVNFLF